MDLLSPLQLYSPHRIFRVTHIKDLHYAGNWVRTDLHIFPYLCICFTYIIIQSSFYRVSRADAELETKLNISVGSNSTVQPDSLKINQRPSTKSGLIDC